MREKRCFVCFTRKKIKKGEAKKTKKNGGGKNLRLGKKKKKTERKKKLLTSAHRLVESAIIEKWYPMSLKYSASVIPV